MDYQPGDVLVQIKGEPWVSFAHLFTGHPNPHARMVSRVEGPVVYVVEDTGIGVVEHVVPDLDLFEVWRPRCDDAIKQQAIAWAKAHIHEQYGYARMIWIVCGDRLGLYAPLRFAKDDTSQDLRPKVCSELIALAYYRAGYDLVPAVMDTFVLPYHLRNPDTCTLIT